MLVHVLPVRHAAAIICAFLAVGLLLSSAATAQGQRAKLVGVDEVVTQPLAQTVPVLGRLIAVQRGTVAALTRGPVLRVHVGVGDRVNEGDVLVTQAMDRLEAVRDSAQEAVDAARATVATAQSQLELATQELDRLEKLRNSAAFSVAQRDDKAYEVAVRRAQVTEARAEVGEALAYLAETQLDVDLGIIRAPFDGVVAEKHTIRGAYLTVGDPVISLINDSDMEVEADVPTNRIPGLPIGREVDLDMGTGVAHSAVVRAVVPEENALSRTRLVRLIPDFAEDSLLTQAAGQTATIHVPVGEARDVVTVHKDAVLPRGGGNSVYVVGEDGTVAPRPVQLGEAAGSRFVVLGGLTPGDIVVIRGNERLRPGDAVTWPGAPERAPESTRAGSSG